MCAVFGILNAGGGIDPAQVDAAIEAMRHRGPDGTGRWIAPARDVALGHARLALVDLEGGAQPLHGEDGGVVAVVNGELYSTATLRAELASAGHVFQTRSDSELLVHLYESRGEACLDALRGEFAFVLWDARRQRLFAARDRFGVKPLCYAHHRGALLLASEAKGLFAAGLPARWDNEAFFLSASCQYLPPDRTLFAGVRALPPGCFLRAERGNVTVVRYWDLDLPPADAFLRASESARDAEAAAALRTGLEEAVALRLRADVPVAVHLSGGLDSSAVLGLAARHADRPLHAFTVAFDDPAYDERGLAEESATRAGAVLHTVHATPEALAAALPDAVARAEGLAINAHLPAKFLLSRAVRDAGFKAVVTGEGADELFLGYPHFKRDLLRLGHPAAGPAAALEASNAASIGLQLPEGQGLSLEAVQRRLGFVPSFMEAKATLGLRMHRVLSNDFRAAFERVDPYARLLESFDVEAQLAGRHPVQQSQYLWARLALPQYILRTLADGTEMAHGVEGRLPFLDSAVVAPALTAPLALSLREGCEKYVLREAVRDVVSETVYRRVKHPFLAPPLAAGDRLTELLQDTLRTGDGARFPFIDRARLRERLDRHAGLTPRERTAEDPVLMLALTASLLSDRLRL